MPSRTSRPADHADRAALASFLWRVRPLPALTWDEEQATARAVAREGCPVARQRLIGANLRLVADVARAYSGRGVPMGELMRAGNIGLLRAVDGFEPALGARFSTHAAWWIKQSIRSAISPRTAGPQEGVLTPIAGLPPLSEVAAVASVLDGQSARTRQSRMMQRPAATDLPGRRAYRESDPQPTTDERRHADPTPRTPHAPRTPRADRGRAEG